MPGTACRYPPLNPARLSQPPDASTPRAPIARDEVGDPGEARPGSAALGWAARAPGKPRQQHRESNSRRRGPPRRSSAIGAREGGAAGPGPGPGRRAGQPTRAAVGGERREGAEILPSSRHTRPRPAGRWGRRAGGGEAVPRRRLRRARRGRAAGEREAENARRGQLPSGGRREMQLSLRACRRGHKWGRAGRSGLRAGRGPGRSAPRPSPDTRSLSREEGSRNGVRRQHGGGGWGTPGENQENPRRAHSHLRTSRSDSPAGGQEGVSQGLGLQGRAGCRASCPSSVGERRQEGAPARGWGGDTRDLGSEGNQRAGLHREGSECGRTSEAWDR